MFTTTNKALRVFGSTAVVGAIGLLGACSPNSEDVNVNVKGSVTMGCIGKGCDGNGGRIVPPAGYQVKWSRCTNWVEGEAKIRNHSRIVNVADDGTIPIVRTEPVVNGKDNVRRVKVAALPKPPMGGSGLDTQSGKPVKFVKLGQLVNVKDANGIVTQWVIGSEHLGETVVGKDGKRIYRDRCYRNPKTVGKDTAGYTEEGRELAATCVVEDVNQEWNALSAITGWSPLVNYADTKVATYNNPATRPHPDDATYEGYFSGAHWYSGYGASLNDINGTERESSTEYLTGDEYCHMIVSGGIEVPGSKRVATKSLPVPGAVNAKTFVTWRPVNPNVTIANELEAVPPPPPPDEPVEEPIEEEPAPVEEVIADSETEAEPASF